MVAPYTGGDMLFGPGLARVTLARRYRVGARFETLAADGAIPAGCDVLLVIRAGGRLAPVTAAQTPATEPGDTLLLSPPARLGPA